MAASQERARREFKIEQDGKQPEVATTRKVTPEELAEHTADNDLWIALHGLVYNVTNWMTGHPGGKTVLKSVAGKDGTMLFSTTHGGRGPLIMIAEELGKQVELIGEFDAPAVEDDGAGSLQKEYVGQVEEQHAFVIHGAVDFEEEIQIGKSNILKTTSVGPTTTLWISGQTADGTTLDRGIKEQSDLALSNMREELEKAGASLTDIVKLNAYIVGINKEKIGGVARAMNGACESWGRPYDLLKPNAKSKRWDVAKNGPAPGPPAITWVGTTGLAIPKALVEIEAVAVIPGKSLSKL